MYEIQLLTRSSQNITHTRQYRHYFAEIWSVVGHQDTEKTLSKNHKMQKKTSKTSFDCTKMATHV